MHRSSLKTRLETVGRNLWRRLGRTRHLAAPPYAGVIREAERCQATTAHARRFCETGGLERLEQAIEAAEADGHDEWARRGRVARRALSPRGTTIPDDE